ncbi:unnamed protein product [Blepharisma stoltei]|uniref:Uncharacterized protein n=1 Tax=Blepharisma stoltei TaxID=1481888 RepID=A0AAU9JJ55_9CILI|nr:unnamed protein product [Blepharisma stoltei]
MKTSTPDYFRQFSKSHRQGKCGEKPVENLCQLWLVCPGKFGLSSCRLNQRKPPMSFRALAFFSLDQDKTPRHQGLALFLADTVEDTAHDRRKASLLGSSCIPITLCSINPVPPLERKESMPSARDTLAVHGIRS